MKRRHFHWEGAEETAAAIRAWTAASAPKSTSSAIEREVREGGDGAVLCMTARFDATEQAPTALRVGPRPAPRRWPRSTPACANRWSWRRRMSARWPRPRSLPTRKTVELPQGQTVTVREVPVGAAGLYAPGGRAAYPSSVLMCAIPARVAGVERIALASPPKADGRVNPLVLAAAELCGVEEIYAMGGAQAIFALAHGTETIAPVDVIAGPGNAWVREAKRAVSGTVGIDSLAGPSELMLVAGDGTDPEWAALDLCAQAEHGAEGPLVAVAVEEAVLEASRWRQRRPPSGTGIGDAPLALVQVPDLSDAIDLANAFAPEHLELFEEDAALLAERVTYRRLRLRRSLWRDRLRRLRRRLQPRAADRRRRSLLRPARPGRLPPPDRRRAGARRGGGEACPARRRPCPRRGLPGPRRVGDD